jgi:hypothetical protein
MTEKHRCCYASHRSVAQRHGAYSTPLQPTDDATLHATGPRRVSGTIAAFPGSIAKSDEGCTDAIAKKSQRAGILKYIASVVNRFRSTHSWILFAD